MGCRTPDILGVFENHRSHRARACLPPPHGGRDRLGKDDGAVSDPRASPRAGERYGHRVALHRRRQGALAQASGGVLRDLVALAKSAAQEAYVSGAEQVSLEHVERASDGFGRILAIGLDGEQVTTLEKLRERNTLVIRGELELKLLETRRALDYGGGRFIVHPTLSPLLDQITVAA